MREVGPSAHILLASLCLCIVCCGVVMIIYCLRSTLVCLFPVPSSAAQMPEQMGGFPLDFLKQVVSSWYAFTWCHSTYMYIYVCVCVCDWLYEKGPFGIKVQFLDM